MTPPPASPPLRAVLDAPIRLLQQHAPVLLPWVLALEAVSLLPNTAVVFWQSTQPPLDMSLGLDLAFAKMMAATWGAVGLGWLVRLAAVLALLRMLQVCLDGRTPDSDDTLGVAFSPRFYGTALMKSLFIWLGAMFCVVPGAALAVLLGLTAPVMLHEGITGFQAFDRSYRLVMHGRGVWGRTALIQVLLAGGVYWAMTWVLSTMASLPVLIWTWVATFGMLTQGGDAPSVAPTAPLWATLLTQAIMVLARAVSDLYLAGALLLIYREARDRAEGGDLEAALQARLGT